MSKVMAVLAMAAALLLADAARAADQPDKLVLQLHSPAQFEFAGYYAALWQGFYRDAGINVEIRPGVAPEAGRGQTPTDAVREVAEGRAQFGTGGADLVVRAAQGLPIELLAPIFQRSGAAIYYRADEDFASPGALADAKIGRLPASDNLDVELATALRAEGVDPDKVKSVPLQPGDALAALADGNVDAVPGSVWDFPWLAHQRGLALKSINPADYRVEFYGDTLFAMRRRVEAGPEVARAFRAASLKGWDYALQHPDEIAARLLAEFPPPEGVGDPAGFLKYQAELAQSLARYPNIALGHSNPDRWNSIETSMAGVGAILRTADSGDFLYDPDAVARRRHDQRSLAIVGAALFVGLVILALLGWRLLRWPRAATEIVASGPVPEASASPPAAVSAPSPPSPGKPAAAVVAGEPGKADAPLAPMPPLVIPAAKPDPAPADLNPVLGRLERAIRRRIPRAVNFRLSLLPDLWRCRAEPHMVETLVLDLVDAAATDLGGHGELIVGTRNYAFDEKNLATTPGAKLGEYVRVTVRDNGPGLAEDALGWVFDRNLTKRPAALAAAEATRALGGFARVESAEGVGTAVHLYLPRAAVEAKVKPAEAAA